MVVKIEFKKQGKIINEKYTDMNKAKNLIKDYKQDKIEIKELAGAEQILIVVGGIILGHFATDIANRIASEID
ncbi:MAG: hypothetical protein KKG94_04490 [Nanoarchaeota archaeon]|nr:hypothetical protein [Nanoarchaeota archaeon]